MVQQHIFSRDSQRLWKSHIFPESPKHSGNETLEIFSRLWKNQHTLWKFSRASSPKNTVWSRGTTNKVRDHELKTGGPGRDHENLGYIYIFPMKSMHFALSGQRNRSRDHGLQGGGPGRDHGPNFQKNTVSE